VIGLTGRYHAPKSRGRSTGLEYNDLMLLSKVSRNPLCGLALMTLVMTLPACSSPQPTPDQPAAAGAAHAGGAVDTSGRRLVVKDGTEYYCKRQKVTGTRLRSVESCLTREQLAQQQNSVRSFINDGESRSGPPREQ
jgi:hypothetical protein